jgi:orotate phosphoribosyltransferase
VTSAIVVVDREQGGRHNVAEKGVIMQSLCTLSQVRPQGLNQTVNSSRK